MRIGLFTFICLLFLTLGCKTAETGVKNLVNQLNKVEKSQGWTLLFDGETTKGWHGFNKDAPGPAWQVSNGILYLDHSKGDAGDLISNEEYENFEFALDWKIQDCGNSGIFWNIVESPEFQFPWLTGPEMQILDNECHPDAKIRMHRAGDLYDMIETSVANVNPAGQWNSIKIVSDHGKMTFWQNNVAVVKFTMHTPEWKEMLANSKFKDMPSFGLAKKGRIGLQDHGDMVHFRNIKIRRI